MDIEYLKEKIKDEMCDSEDYARRAIELKPMTESWSKKFYDMSVDEHKHAEHLYLMFQEYCSKISNTFTDVPEYIDDAKKEVMDCYINGKAKLKVMWDIYK